jgi:transposase
MIGVKITEAEYKELKSHRRQASSKDSEKILMVLLSAEGRSVSEISEILKRHPHTVRYWLTRYNQEGISGLRRKYSHGRSRDKRETIKVYIEETLLESPDRYGYSDASWSIGLIKSYLKQEYNFTSGDLTINRALKELGYRYKRPSKKPPKVMSKEECELSVRTMIDKIKEIKNRNNCEIYALDESHFSNEPYIVKGWFFKRNAT